MKNYNQWRVIKEAFENHENPFKQEMKNFLKQEFQGLMDVNSNDFEFDSEAAIYWFSSDYHKGQSSDLYSILSTSQYNPSRMSQNINSEPETTQMLYQALVDNFKNL